MHEEIVTFDKLNHASPFVNAHLDVARLLEQQSSLALLSDVSNKKIVKRDFRGLRRVLMIHWPNASFGTATFLSDRPDRLRQFWRHKAHQAESRGSNRFRIYSDSYLKKQLLQTQIDSSCSPENTSFCQQCFVLGLMTSRMPSCLSILSHGRRSVMSVKRQLQGKK